MLVLQDPTNSQSTYLLESLLDSFRHAEKAAGAFAFASSAGIRLLTEDETFKEMANSYPVDLIVGLDAVTNTRALDTLTSLSKSHSNVQIRAFLNPKRESLFHPKFCWTKNGTGGCLITGSGNLTEGGLLGHWEAYSVERLTSTEIDVVESSWNSWTTRHSASLLPLDNPEVRQLAEANNVMSPEGDLPTLIASTKPRKPATQEVIIEPTRINAEVLVTEIPRASNRWNQANFHKEDFEGYFGARAGKLFVFRHVSADGTMAAYERTRPPVTVKSRNFRFELAAAAGLQYPDEASGRPIGVFIKVATRTFLYRIMMPGDNQYSLVSGILERHASPSGKMRALRTTVAELHREWPAAPFWKLPPAT